MPLKYSVTTLRAAGLEAKWGKTRAGAPMIAARDPNGKLEHQRATWWLVDGKMWKSMEKDGVKKGFDSCTLLGDVFYI